jgi:hypothetical protein
MIKELNPTLRLRDLCIIMQSPLVRYEYVSEDTDFDEPMIL